MKRMNSFFEDKGNIYCKRCDEKNIVHDVHVIIETKTAFEVEANSLRKPKLIKISTDTPIELRCTCCKTTEILEQEYINYLNVS